MHKIDMKTVKIIKKHPIISIAALAKYYGVHRNTMARRAAKLDRRNIYEILDFVREFDKKG